MTMDINRCYFFGGFHVFELQDVRSLIIEFPKNSKKRKKKKKERKGRIGENWQISLVKVFCNNIYLYLYLFCNNIYLYLWSHILQRELINIWYLWFTRKYISKLTGDIYLPVLLSITDHPLSLSLYSVCVCVCVSIYLKHPPREGVTITTFQRNPADFPFPRWLLFFLK